MMPILYVMSHSSGTKGIQWLVQTAVCVVELWPEARKCREDARLFQGIALGAFVMAGTLAVGV